MFDEYSLSNAFTSFEIFKMNLHQRQNGIIHLAVRIKILTCYAWFTQTTQTQMQEMNFFSYLYF